MDESRFTLNESVYSELLQILSIDPLRSGDRCILLSEQLSDNPYTWNHMYYLKIINWGIKLVKCRYTSHAVYCSHKKYYLWHTNINHDEHKQVQKQLRNISKYGHANGLYFRDWTKHFMFTIKTTELYEKIIALLNQLYDVPMTKRAIG